MITATVWRRRGAVATQKPVHRIIWRRRRRWEREVGVTRGTALTSGRRAQSRDTLTDVSADNEIRKQNVKIRASDADLGDDTLPFLFTAHVLEAAARRDHSNYMRPIVCTERMMGYKMWIAIITTSGLLGSSWWLVEIMGGGRFIRRVSSVWETVKISSGSHCCSAVWPFYGATGFQNGLYPF